MQICKEREKQYKNWRKEEIHYLRLKWSKVTKKKKERSAILRKQLGII